MQSSPLWTMTLGPGWSAASDPVCRMEGRNVCVRAGVLARPGADEPACLVLDLPLPELSGLDLQKRMAEVGLESRIA